MPGCSAVSPPLLDSRGHSTNVSLPAAGTPGSLDHSVIIAVHHGRKWTVEPVPVETPPAPRVVAVNTSNDPGSVYAAGSLIQINVVFDVPVSVHCVAESTGSRGASCPGLVLRTREGGSGGVFSGDFAHRINLGSLVSICDRFGMTVRSI